MNILVVVESFYDGGAEMFAIRLANELAGSEHVFFLEFYPYRSTEKWQKKIIDSNKIRIIQVGKNIFSGLLNSVKSKNSFIHQFQRLRRWLNKKEVIALIKKNRIEIVHSHSWDTDLYFAKLKDEIPFKMVSSFHGHYELMKNKGAYFQKHAKFALERIDKVVYLTDMHAVTLGELNVPHQKRKKIFHGLSAGRSNEVIPLEQDAVIKFALVARGIPEKGWEQVIEAFTALNEKYPGRTELHLIGGSSYVDDLEKTCNSSNIFFHGYCEDVMARINTMHVGLLPSYYAAESLPVSVIEFLFCGKPVIASNIGAIKEMLMSGDRTAGVLLELKDGKTDATDILHAAEIYINDPYKIKEHAATALLAAKKFDMPSCVNAYKELYAALLT